MVYVLATFVVVPRRWIDEHGYRNLSPAEVAASVRYWQRVGQLMGISGIPQGYEAFEHSFDGYEAARFGYSPGGRAVADATLALFVSWYPSVMRGLLRPAILSLMDEPLRGALRYPRTSTWLSGAVRAGLAGRRRLIAQLPARRNRRRATDSRQVKGYPLGWDVARVGSFPQQEVAVQLRSRTGRGPRPRRYPLTVRAHSSVGQSACLTSRMPGVQVPLRPPAPKTHTFQGRTAFYDTRVGGRKLDRLGSKAEKTAILDRGRYGTRCGSFRVGAPVREPPSRYDAPRNIAQQAISTEPMSDCRVASTDGPLRGGRAVE